MLYFESETVLKFYNCEAWKCRTLSEVQTGINQDERIHQYEMGFNANIKKLFA